MIKNKFQNIYKHFNTERYKSYLPHISLFVIIIVFGYKTLLLKDFGGDFIAYFLPHYRFILNEIKTNGIPYWYPFAYNGLPEVFKSELALFHPVTVGVFILDLLFNSRNSLNITGNLFEFGWFAYLGFGAIGAYEFIYRAFNTRKLSAFIGALCFALNPLMLPTMNTNVFLGVAALPWALLAASKFVDKPSISTSIFVIFTNYLIFSAGYPYFYVYFLLVQIGYVALFGFKKLVAFGVVFAVSALICSFFLLPNVYIYSQSVRDNSRDQSDLQLFTSNIPTRIINILNPMPYGKSFSELDPSSIFTSNGVSWGTFILIFLVTGIFAIKNERKYFWLVASFLIAFVYSFGGYFYSSQFFSTFIPIIDKFRSHSISLVITMLMGCVFISIGIDSTLDGRRNKYIEQAFGFILLTMTLALSFIPVFCPNCSTQGLPQILSLARTIFLLFVSIIIYALTVKFRMQRYIFLGILFLLIEFHFYFLNLNGHFLDTKYSNFYQKNKLIPDYDDKKLFRSYFDNNQFSYNTSLPGVFSYAGYETIPYKGWYGLQNRYGFNKSLRLSNVKYMITSNPNWGAQNAEASIKEDTSPVERPNETYVSTVAGLPYLSSKSQNTHYIYELSKYEDRFFIPEKVYGCNDDCDVKENLPQVVVLKNQSKISYMENPLSDQVKIDTIRYVPNQIDLEVTSTKPTFIVASETWDSGWKIKVNGKEQDLYKISDYFRGFNVEPGDKIKVTMSYFPPLLIAGSIVSFFGLISLGVMIIFRKRLFKLINS